MNKCKMSMNNIQWSRLKGLKSTDAVASIFMFEYRFSILFWFLK